MEVGSNQRWTTASTITSWPYFHSTVTQNWQNLTQLQLCSNSVRVHSYAYVPHWTMLKHFTYIHYGCGKQSAVVYSLNHNIMASFHLTVAKNCLNQTQHRQCNGVRVHSYAYVSHKKVEKHFIYVNYGCGKQSKGDNSLNHDIMASFPLNSHPELLKTNHSGFSSITV